MFWIIGVWWLSKNGGRCTKRMTLIHVCIYYKFFLYSENGFANNRCAFEPSHHILCSRDHESKLHMSPICLDLQFVHNLKKGAAVSTLPDGNGSSSVIPLAPGNYTIDSLVEELNNMKKIKSIINLTAKINMPLGSMVINNQYNLRFSVNLVTLAVVTLHTFT